MSQNISESPLRKTILSVNLVMFDLFELKGSVTILHVQVEANSKFLKFFSEFLKNYFILPGKIFTV